MTAPWEIEYLKAMDLRLLAERDGLEGKVEEALWGMQQAAKYYRKASELAPVEARPEIIHREQICHFRLGCLEDAMARHLERKLQEAKQAAEDAKEAEKQTN